MSRSLSITTFVAALSLAGPAVGQNLASAARDLIQDRSGATQGCLVNGHRQVNERKRENALVWKDPSGSWRAVVARTDVNSTAPAAAPCWAAPGRCAIYFGPLPDLSSECTLSRSGIDIAGQVPELLHIALINLYGDTVLTGGEALMRLAKGLMPEDTLVMALPGTDVFMSKAADATLRARFVIGSGTVNVARLRTDPAGLNPPKLVEYSQALASTDLLTAGPLGAVSTGGVVVTDDKNSSDVSCFALADPTAFQTRLAKAEAELEITGMPTPGPKTEMAYDDLLQTLLGSNFTHGPAQDFSIAQDPRIFLSTTGEEVACPG